MIDVLVITQLDLDGGWGRDCWSDCVNIQEPLRETSHLRLSQLSMVLRSSNVDNTAFTPVHSGDPPHGDLSVYVASQMIAIEGSIFDI